MGFSNKHYRHRWTKLTITIYSLALMDHRFTLLLRGQVSFIFVPQIQRPDIDLDCFENTCLWWYGLRDQRARRLNASPNIPNCVCCWWQQCLCKRRHTFSTLYVCIMLWRKLYHISGSPGFSLLLLYFSSKQASLVLWSLPSAPFSLLVPYVPNHPCARCWQSHFLFSCYPWVVFQSFVG